MTVASSLLAVVLVLQGAALGPVRVQFDGVSREQRRNIRAHVTLYQRRAETDMPESTVRALYERAPQEIRVALRPFGYYRPRIRSELERRRDGWVARYQVDPGPPVQYASVRLGLTGAGGDDPAFQGILTQLGVREGAVLRHARWEQAKQTLLNQAAGRGYLDVRVTRSRVEADTTAGTARAVLEVATGPRYRFGDVRFPETPFTASFMNRFVTFRPGEPFDLDALLAMQRSMTASDYFRLVQLEPLRDQADGLRVPIQVRMELQDRTNYTVGLGYGTDTGARASASGQRRWLNAAGHRVRGEARASLRSQSVSTRYVIPLGGGVGDQIAASGTGQRDAFEGLESRRISARAELDHGRGAWREVLSLRLAEEWSRDGTVSSRTTLLVPEAAWSRVWGDDVIYPRRGLRIQLGVSGATTTLLSDVSFVQATAQVTAARGLYPGARLLFRANVGATGVDSLLALPVSVRLYAGGDQSVRGFGFRTLGPVGADSTVTGGKFRLTGSVELEQMVWRQFGLAVFTDVGNVFAAAGDITSSALAQGAGFGLRWRSPIGLVRADLAWPVSRPGAGPRIHFVVGGVL